MYATATHICITSIRSITSTAHYVVININSQEIRFRTIYTKKTPTHSLTHEMYERFSETLIWTFSFKAIEVQTSYTCLMFVSYSEKGAKSG